MSLILRDITNLHNQSQKQKTQSSQSQYQINKLKGQSLLIQTCKQYKNNNENNEKNMFKTLNKTSLIELENERRENDEKCKDEKQNGGWQSSPQNQDKFKEVSLFRKFQKKINSFETAYKKQHSKCKQSKNINKIYVKNKQNQEGKQKIRNYLEILSKQDKQNTFNCPRNRTSVERKSMRSSKNYDTRNQSLKILPYQLKQSNEIQKQIDFQPIDIEFINKNYFLRCKEPVIGFNQQVINVIDSERNNLRSRVLKNKLKSTYQNQFNCTKSKTETKFDSFFINESHREDVKKEHSQAVINRQRNSEFQIIRPSKAYSSLSSQSQKRPTRRGISLNKKTDGSSTSILNNLIFQALNEQLQKRSHTFVPEKIFNPNSTFYRTKVIRK